MKSEKSNVAFTGWLVLALLMGVVAPSYSEQAHDTSKGQEASAARPKAATAPVPAEYEQLLTALSKVDSRGLSVKSSTDLDGKTETAEVAISDIVRLREFVTNAKKYREFLTGCAIKFDKSADLFGKFLDGFITSLQSHITDDPRNASGLKEKELVTYVSQIERFLKEKGSLFSSQKSDFEKSDETLLRQIKASVGLFFNGFHESKFDVTRQASDAETKPIADRMTAAIEALSSRERSGEKTCKLSEEKSSEDAKNDGDDKASKNAKSEKNDSKRPDLSKPGPLDTEKQDVAKDEGEKREENNNDIPPGGDNIPFFDPGVNNNAGNQVGDFDADALLKGVLDRFADLERRAKEDQDRAKRDVQDGFDAVKRLADDITRQNQAALDAQKNQDNGLENALKALQPQQTPPPVIPPPPASPPVIPPTSNGEGNQSPLLPQQPQEAQGPQDGGQQYPPMMPQAPQSSSQPIVIGGEDSKFEEDYYKRRFMTPPTPAVNPQQAAQLEYMRLQQQLMFAQQQAAQGGSNGVRVNVNSIANRLAGGVGGAPGTARQIPSLANKAAGGTATSLVSGSRSSTVPAALRGATGQKM